MSVEKERTDTGTPISEEDEDDLGALCEGISRAIVEGLTSEDRPEEPDLPMPPEAALAETGLILPLGDMVTEKAVSTVEGLLDSEEVADRIARVAEEKLQEVLNNDLAKSRTGEAGVIAERVHLECARLFGRASFRKELVRFLQHDIARNITPIIKQDVAHHIHHVMAEVTELILNRIAEVLPAMRGAAAPQQGTATDDEVARIRDEVLAQVRREFTGLSNQIHGRLAVALRSPPRAVATHDQESVVSSRPAPPAYGAVCAADPADRIRDRLWAEGLL
jgi:hypothetical protein